jgi:hypothetical protein
VPCPECGGESKQLFRPFGRLRAAVTREHKRPDGERVKVEQVLHEDTGRTAGYKTHRQAGYCDARITPEIPAASGGAR